MTNCLSGSGKGPGGSDGERRGNSTTFETSPSFLEVMQFSKRWHMADLEQLNKLSRLIDEAYYYAIQTNQDMAAFVLAVASQEVTEQLEGISQPCDHPD